MKGLMDLFRKLYLNWIKVGTKKELTSEREWNFWFFIPIPTPANNPGRILYPFEKDSGLNVSGEAAGETRIPDLLPESRDRDHHHHHSNK